MERLYPDNWPYSEMEAAPENFEIVTVGNKGEGLKTKKAFRVGEVVFSFTGIVRPYQTLFTLQRKEGEYVEDPYVMGKVLHSCDPNMSCDMKTQTFTALKEIPAGTLLTMDYHQTEKELFRQFDCGCGSENCRGKITGYGLEL